MPDTPEDIMGALLATSPKRIVEWDNLKEHGQDQCSTRNRTS